MSVVNNYLVCCDLDEEREAGGVPAIGRLNALILDGCGEHDAFRNLDGHAGGRKAMEALLFGWAANHILTENLCVWIKAAQFHDPARVQLLVQEQGDDCWRLVNWPEIEKLAAIREPRPDGR